MMHADLDLLRTSYTRDRRTMTEAVLVDELFRVACRKLEVDLDHPERDVAGVEPRHRVGGYARASNEGL